MKASSFLPLVLLAGCSLGAPEPPAPPQQLVTTHEAGDANSDDPRLLFCFFGYETVSPPSVPANVEAATLSTTMGAMMSDGASASDGRYALEIVWNTDPSSVLPFNAIIADGVDFHTISYLVQPAPQTSGIWLFELGAKIPPVQVADDDPTMYDFVRGSCQVVDP